ncbi:MAG: hypothetical protein COB30_009710 [Ectothiorhodospiraceae bacterium]|nr:hypothetical protein [Ectothiorhodospiraceae bacterium]
MNNNVHLELEQLAAFSDDPAAAEHSVLRRHLASCVDCRLRLDQVNAVSSSLLTSPPSSESATLSDELLHAIDNEQLSDEHRRALNNDPSMLKAALHYAAHAPAMSNTLSSGANTSQATLSQSAPARHAGFLQRLIAWRPPAWGTIPVSAAVAFALAFLVLPYAISPQGTSELIVASYSDKPILSLHDTTADLPGMGFFHAADAQEIPFDGLRISYKQANGLFVNWAPVENTLTYHLRLTQVSAEGQRVIAELDVTQAQAHFPLLVPTPGRYQWLLSGQTTNNTHFKASGGFVVNHFATKNPS